MSVIELLFSRSLLWRPLKQKTHSETLAANSLRFSQLERTPRTLSFDTSSWLNDLRV